MIARRIVLGALLFASLAVVSEARAGNGVATTMGYDCSTVDEVGLPFMPPRFPQKVVARRIVFLERPQEGLSFFVGPELDLDDGTRALWWSHTVMVVKKAATDQLLRTLALSSPGSFPPAMPYKNLMDEPASLTAASCDAPKQEQCSSARPLRSELPNALPARIAQRWEIWRTVGGTAYKGYARLGWVYESDSGHYFLDSFGWIVPISTRDDAIAGLHSISNEPQPRLSSFLNGLQRGTGRLVEIPCATQQGSCRAALPVATTVNSVAAEDLAIQTVDELDYVSPPVAYPLGFVYRVRSGQSYLGTRSAMIALGGRDTRDALAKLEPYDMPNILASYEKGQTGWRVAYGRCATDQKG